MQFEELQSRLPEHYATFGAGTPAMLPGYATCGGLTLWVGGAVGHSPTFRSIASAEVYPDLVLRRSMQDYVNFV